MQLYYRDFPSESNATPLMMLHGLFGSSTNLQFFAKKISAQRQVILPDLRNHGRSPHHHDMNFQVMAEDVLNLLDQLSIEKINMLGHSMGGKVAMWLALNHSERIEHLLIADISPVTYPNRFIDIISAMQNIDLDNLTSRNEADKLLGITITDVGVRAYLLQNLMLTDTKKWRWRLNLKAIENEMGFIMSFPNTASEYERPVLFLKGEYSDYLASEYESQLYRYFPLADILTISEAGHWLYAEQPEQFLKAVTDFISH